MKRYVFFALALAACTEGSPVLTYDLNPAPVNLDTPDASSFDTGVYADAGFDVEAGFDAADVAVGDAGVDTGADAPGAEEDVAQDSGPSEDIGDDVEVDAGSGLQSCIEHFYMTDNGLDTMYLCFDELLDISEAASRCQSYGKQILLIDNQIVNVAAFNLARDSANNDAIGAHSFAVRQGRVPVHFNYDPDVFTYGGPGFAVGPNPRANCATHRIEQGSSEWDLVYCNTIGLYFCE